MTEQSIEGRLQHDRHHYADYVRIEGKFVKTWIFDRLKEIPEGSYVKITAEVLDVPHD